VKSLRSLLGFFKGGSLIDRNLSFHLIEIVKESSLLQVKTENIDRDSGNEH
jgi:hypothetical protein